MDQKVIVAHTSDHSHGRFQLGRIRRYLTTQYRAVHYRLWLAQMVIACIPYGMFGNVRAMLYRWAGFAAIGRKVYFHGALTLRGAGNIYPNLHIGDRTTINSPCFIDMSAPVHIGNQVGIGHHVVIITSNHELGPSHERRGPLKPKPVTIGDGVWIGARVTILPGVTIGPGAFLTAGAVVTKDVPANAKVAGNHATVVGFLEP
jgi:maltose O-acetyltransferase